MVKAFFLLFSPVPEPIVNKALFTETLYRPLVMLSELFYP